VEDVCRDAQGWSSKGHNCSVLPKLAEKGLMKTEEQGAQGWGALTAKAVTFHI